MLTESLLATLTPKFAVQRSLIWRRKLTVPLSECTAPLSPPPSLIRCIYLTLAPVRCPLQPAVTPALAPQPDVGMVRGMGIPKITMSITASELEQFGPRKAE